jgi:hypothetical protein
MIIPKHLMNRPVPLRDQSVEPGFPERRERFPIRAFVAVRAAHTGTACGHEQPTPIVITQLEGMVKAGKSYGGKRAKITAKIRPGPAALFRAGRGNDPIDLWAARQNSFGTASDGNPDLCLGKSVSGCDNDRGDQ